ncbi:MAG: nucleotidyltransferase domain-containing protein [Deltaproteobacteria bacterium]|nr:nucleotidyltransferase domain-containing protein [Deltaproteobacteria bacterium]
MPHERLEDGLRALLRDAPPEVLSAWLFGSEARGEAGEHSDVDVAVLYATPPASRLAAGPLDLEGALERALGRPVQLTVLNRAPADLVHRVLRDGRLLLDRDRAARIRFEVERRNEYFDLAPLRARYRAGGRRAS